MSKVNVNLDAKLERDGSLVCLLDFDGRKAKVIFGGPPNMDVVFEALDEPCEPVHHHHPVQDLRHLIIHEESPGD